MSALLWVMTEPLTHCIAVCGSDSPLEYRGLQSNKTPLLQAAAHTLHLVLNAESAPQQPAELAPHGEVITHAVHCTAYSAH